MLKDGKIKAFWMNLTIEQRCLAAVVSIMIALILVYWFIATVLNFVNDRRYKNDLNESIIKTEQNKTNSNIAETNANVLTPQIEASRVNTNIATNTRIQAQTASNAKRIEINKALKQYEQDKIHNNNRAISNDELSDDAIRQRANKLGITVE